MDDDFKGLWVGFTLPSLPTLPDLTLYVREPVCGWYDKVEFWARSERTLWATLTDMLLLRGPDWSDE